MKPTTFNDNLNTELIIKVVPPDTPLRHKRPQTETFKLLDHDSDQRSTPHETKSHFFRTQSILNYNEKEELESLTSVKIISIEREEPDNIHNKRNKYERVQSKG